MRGLTLHRPWPWTIFHLPAGLPVGAKRLENRPMRPPACVFQREPLALHSGLTWDDKCTAYCRSLGVEVPHRDSALPRERGSDPVFYCHPSAAIIGLVRVVAWVEGEPARNGVPGRLLAHQGVSRGEALALLSDPWFFGPFAWVLADVRALPRPVAHRGMQGTWTVEPQAELAVLNQLA